MTTQSFGSTQSSKQVQQHHPRAATAEEIGSSLQIKRHRNRWQLSPLLIGCMMVILGFVVCALFAHWLAPHDPIANNLVDRLKPPAWLTGADPTYPLGTDALGRDVLSRLIYGARVSLAIGFIGTLVGVIIGALSGLVAGYIGGAIDEALMFLVDAYVALPFLVVALTVIAVLGSDLGVLIILASASGWAGYTRLSRGQVLTIRQQPYVLAAKALGVPPRQIMVRHVLPNILAPLIVLATFGMTSIILLESSLSFLGLGIQPPTPAWGSMLGDGRDYLHTAWWIGIFPGIAIMLLTMAISLLGDWLRDLLDPTLRGR